MSDLRSDRQASIIPLPGSWERRYTPRRRWHEKCCIVENFHHRMNRYVQTHMPQVVQHQPPWCVSSCSTHPTISGTSRGIRPPRMAGVQITQGAVICRPPGMAGVQITQRAVICRPPGMAEVQKMHDSRDGGGRAKQEARAEEHICHSMTCKDAGNAGNVGAVASAMEIAAPAFLGLSRHTVHPWT